jgi:3-oxoacyl-[acyl-carrier-protein] synthase-1
MDKNGEWITGSYVPLEQPWRGRAKLVHLVVPAIRECLSAVDGIPTEKIPLFLCIAEKDRPGRLSGLDDLLLDEVQEELNLQFHKKSAIIPQGRVAGVIAIQEATTLLYHERLLYCIVAGVDTFLTAGILAAMEEKERILTGTNSDGFIPGEAGAAILLCPGNQKSNGQMEIKGIGFGKEEAHMDSGEPLRAEGLVQAINGACETSGMSAANLDYRITDANGEQYGFKEAALALTRTLKERKEEFDIWHPVECIGEVGAAIVPVILGVALAAAKKGYAPGNGVLCHFGNDDGQRAAMFLNYPGRGA